MIAQQHAAALGRHRWADTIARRFPKYGGPFRSVATLLEHGFRAFDDRGLRTFVGARAIPALSWRSGGHQSYADWCFQGGVYAGLISALTDRRVRVLDVGCGAGEIVPGVLQSLGEDASYLGVDIDPVAIHRCRQSFTDARARFAVVRGDSTFYTVAADQETSELETLCGDACWDVVIAKALFDHLTPGAAARHLEAFARGLDRDGIVIATFFVVDESFRPAAVAPRFRFDTAHPAHAGFRYAAAFNPIPEAQLAIEQSSLAELVAAAGLSIARVIAGTWRQPAGTIGVDMPDTLVLAHAGTRPR